MKIALLSNHVSGLVKFDYLRNTGFHFDAVITCDPKMAHEQSISGYSDFREAASSSNTSIYTVSSLNLKAPQDLEYFQKNKFDLLVIGGWQRLIPQAILDTLAWGALAEHGSSEELPRGRGRSPIAWTLASGRKRFVLHLFRADSGADSGEIVDVRALELTPQDDIRSVYYKVGIASGQMLLNTLTKIRTHTLTARAEAKVEPTYFRKRGEPDDFVDWSASTQAILDQVRACAAPYPMAKARLLGKPMLLKRCIPFDSFLDFFGRHPGEILQVMPAGEILVKTADGSLLIEDYSYDSRIEVGAIFEKHFPVCRSSAGEGMMIDVL